MALLWVLRAPDPVSLWAVSWGRGCCLNSAIAAPRPPPQHFVCAKCEKPFLGHRHYEKKGLAYCETHYNQVRAEAGQRVPGRAGWPERVWDSLLPWEPRGGC